MNRRRFLQAAGLALTAPMIVPSSILGQGTRPAPSSRITMGVVGWGMMGPGNTHEFLGMPDVQVVAACDLDKNHLAGAVNAVNDRYKNKDCKAYEDYPEMMARKDIDAVMLALPDHWHALTAIEAANSGKDIYGEKPLARTIGEQQAIVKAVQKNSRIWQTGSWQRSQRPFRQAAEIVRNGLIGKLKRVEVGLPSGHHDFAGTSKFMTVSEPPAELNYDLWIGPAQRQPYIRGRVHMNWRWNYNTGGGQLLDWIGHHCDIAHWGMDCDNSGPIEVQATGEFPDKEAVWNTCTRYRATCTYANEVEMIIAGGHNDIRGGTKWIGTEGWVWVDRGGFDASNPDWLASIPKDQHKVQLYVSNGHQRNFIDCVKSRKPTITPVETAHRSAVPGHLALISMLAGRKIRWDAAKEKIVGDPEAAKLLNREYRAPWKSV